MKPPTWNPCLVSTHLVEGDARLAVIEMWTRVEQPVRRAASNLAKEPETEEDLVQEAMIKLWQLDPSRFDVRSRTAISYLRRALINRMRDVVQSEFLRRHPDGLPVELVARLGYAVRRHPITVAVEASLQRSR
jgi:DNA-directed RNA polymerase specialized sigma24 family protein